MKRYFNLFLLLCIAMAGYAQQAKYVFYFIGDGMGLNQVNMTEMYLAEMEGKIGISPLTFASFPVACMATTFSATHPVTDSAASGTALATGHKTYNGAIGLDADKNVVESVALKAKKAGCKVGVATSVSVDHATPACFYAHQKVRKMYHEIALDLPVAGYDFYAGSGFLRPTTDFQKKEVPSIFPVFEKAGYTLIKGYNAYKKEGKSAQKVILVQEDGKGKNSIPYAIDRKEGDLTLSEITESAIDFLSRDNDKGFFLMVEGGKIDWACHDNDPATIIHEVIDMDNAVKLAYEFYKKYPEETLIVITADHETGGAGLGTGKYALNLKALQYQKNSVEYISKKMMKLREEKKNKVTWEEMKEFLMEYYGLWDKLEVSKKQEETLRNEFNTSFKSKNGKTEKSLYTQSVSMAACAKRVLSEIAMVAWNSGGHSAAYTPVFAIGAGSEVFNGKMDNTDIPKRIARVAGY